MSPHIGDTTVEPRREEGSVRRRRVATHRTIEPVRVVHDDPWITATVANIHFNNGKSISDFLLLKTKGNGFISVSARLKDGRFLFVRQCKPTSGMSIESVAGGCRKGTAHARTALHEMIEETGFQPERLIRLNSRGFLPLTDRVNNRCHLFLALDCIPTKEKRVQDEKQGVEAYILTPKEVLDHIRKGKIQDLATLAGIFAHFAYKAGYFQSEN